MVFNLSQFYVDLGDTVFVRLHLFETHRSDLVDVLNDSLVFNFEIDDLTTNLSLLLLALNFLLINLKLYLSLL